MKTSAPSAEKKRTRKNVSKSAPVESVSTESLPTAPNSTWHRNHHSEIYTPVLLTVGVGDVVALNTKLFPNPYAKGGVPVENIKYACHSWNGGGRFGIFFCRDALRHGVIAHEVQHAVLRMAQHCGWDILHETTEPAAFLAGWITKCIYTDLSRHGEVIVGN